MKNRKAWLGLGAVVVVAAILFAVYWAFAPQGKEGAKTITVEVFNGEEFVGNHTLTTDKAYLGDALEEAGLVEGEESATSRFINNDINEIVKLIYTVRGSSRLTDERYMDVQDKVLKLIEYMTGRRDLPAGQSFGNIFKDVNDTLNGYVREVEPAFRNSYVPLMNELIQQARANGNKIGGNAPAAEAKPAQEVEGEPTEIDPGTGLPKA